ncbi:hypothetical protein CSH63_33000 [Micromonospora tulbaghiae]|uniref:Uncharacterized protein n=1 Tax=Micromonospora tulbaghiae TaxID=479978 RepID=A0A386X0L3_9ACTN|nr:hypothetical protein [Micromonospora tulbaghiae]AYF32174.1 hypothetical protein CSH63_33000 [Micromonospora tulbaghiae]
MTDPLLLRVPADTAEALASDVLVPELAAVLFAAWAQCADGPPSWPRLDGGPYPLAEAAGNAHLDAVHLARAVRDWLMGRCVVEAAPHLDQSPALALIGAERIRHLEVKGYDANHDDQYRDGELAGMALWYADDESSAIDWPGNLDDLPARGDRLQDLVRAGSLLAAEVDRLLRERRVRAGSLLAAEVDRLLRERRR